MKIAMGSDHAGFALKEQVKQHLKEMGCEVEDLGTYDEKSCHYPIYAQKVAMEVVSGRAGQGILICGTGAGMAIAANKIKGIRAIASLHGPCGCTMTPMCCAWAPGSLVRAWPA